MTHSKTASEQASAQAMAGSGVRFERIRRITGYLVGTLDLFNDAKQAEERDRIKHINMGRTHE